MASSPQDRDVRTGAEGPPQLAPVRKKERSQRGLAYAGTVHPDAHPRANPYTGKMRQRSNQTDLVALRLMTKIDPAKFRKQADECHEQANEARNPIDQEAWLRLAEDFIKLAEGLEQVRHLRASRPGVDTMPRRTL